MLERSSNLVGSLLGKDRVGQDLDHKIGKEEELINQREEMVDLKSVGSRQHSPGGERNRQGLSTSMRSEEVLMPGS